MCGLVSQHERLSPLCVCVCVCVCVLLEESDDYMDLVSVCSVVLVCE